MEEDIDLLPPLPEGHQQRIQSLDPRSGVSSRLLLNIVSLLVVIGLLAGTAQWWIPQGQHLLRKLFPPKETPVYVQSAQAIMALSSIDGQTIWSTPLVAHDGLIGDSFEQDGMIYILDSSTSITALYAQNGHIAWKLNNANQIIPLNVKGQKLIVLISTGPTQYIIAAIDTQNGHQLWQYQAHSIVNGAFSGNLLLLLETTNANTSQQSNIVLIGLQVDTGQEAWQQILGKNIDTTADNQPLTRLFPGIDRVIATTETIASTNSTYALKAFALSDGHVLWQTAGEGSVVAFDQTHAYISKVSAFFNVKPQLLAIDFRDGREHWHLAGVGSGLLESVPSTTIMGNATLLAQNGSTLMGINSLSGQVQWTQPDIPFLKEAGTNSASEVGIQIGPKGVFYYCDTAHLYALNTLNGKILWTSPTLTDFLGNDGGQPLLSTQDAVYVNTGQTLFAFDATKGSLLWQNHATLTLISTTAPFN